MHFLSLLIASYIFIPIAYSQFGLFFSESLGPDPSLYSAFDPTLHLEESRVGDASSPYPMTELNSDLFSDQNSEPYQTTQPAPNLFLDEDVTLNPMLDSEPSFFLSNNIFCDDYNDNANANDFEFFGKFRRRDSCSSLGMGEDVPSGGSNQEPQFDLEKLIQFLQRPIPVFEASPDICPARMYGSSNTPVCDVPDITNTAVTPSQPESYLLENVYSVIKDPIGCQDGGAKVWCCMTVAPRTELNIPPDKSNEIDAEQLELFRRVVKLLNNAFVCYPRRSTEPQVT